MHADASVPFAAYIHPSNPTSGAYGGMSIAIFPVADAACLLTFVVGTNGLSPDEEILGRPGHARKVKAICSWLNRKHGHGHLVAWAKQDPVRIDEGVPDSVAREFGAYRSVFERYGNVLYGIFKPNDDPAATLDALKAFFDLMFDERGYETLSPSKTDSDAVRNRWFAHLLPEVGSEDVLQLLKTRRYVVIQGPPGTGKTRMAHELLNNAYARNGVTVQFHPNTTYENFVGGLAPVRTSESIGLAFAPLAGHLMQAARAAQESPDRDYLLMIDEINRADLSKILGEAIYLFEPGETRAIRLAYDFGPPFEGSLSIPPNLHVLGTMNSADRSLAIIDVAVRRRFAFAKLWPQLRVVEEFGCPLMQQAFRDLVDIFVEHASDESFDLVPGHSYFLEKDDETARRQLKVTVVPLLEEYLAQGYVSGFAEPIRSYLQWIASL
jgi:5-methylcytosine-specific restriction protein B